MSASSPSYLHVLERFRDALGLPQGATGRKDHWTLPAASASRLSVTVLVEKPPPPPYISATAVWIFDPGDHIEGIERVIINDEAAIDSVLLRIQGKSGGIPHAPAERIG